MTKKDYQAIAGALYSATADRCSAPIPLTFYRCEQRFMRLSGGVLGCPVHGIREPREREAHDMRNDVIAALADVLAADNPRFDRATFVAACEDGNVGRRPKRKREPEPLPPCVRAMACYCAGHARGNAASEPCDTREGA